MSLFFNKTASLNILGILIKQPSILDKVEKYQINRFDFANDLHESIFIAINNLYVNGMNNIETIDIANYLKETYPSKFEIFTKENGKNIIEQALKMSDIEKIDYYYDILKKMSILRTFDEYGIDVRFMYNPEETSFEKISKQEQWLQNVSIEEISNTIQRKIDKAMGQCKIVGDEVATKAGNNIFDTLEMWKENPSIGLPIPFGIYNTVVLGARRRKLYILSASSGVGKTRSMIGECVYLSASKIYDNYKNNWIELPSQVPTLFIATEQDEEEVQSMMLSFISGVNEEHIINPRLCTEEEGKRIVEAARILEEAPIYLKCIEDFSPEEIENIIKINVEEYNIYGVFFDYIHSSMKMLTEISQKVRGISLREDQILFLFSNKLKNIANIYDVYLRSATQTNRSAVNSNENASANMISGASAIINKADVGEVLLKLNDEDKTYLPQLQKAFSSQNPNNLTPNMIRGIYKNRRAKYKDVKVWCYADLGTCRYYPLFVTTNDYKLLDVMEYEIDVEKIK